MKKRILLCAACAAVAAVSVFAGGCDLFGTGGTTNVTVNNNYYTPSDEQWQQYIDSLTPQSGEQLQAAVNRSLMSGVSILTRFTYYERAYYGSAYSVMQSYHSVFCGAGVIVELDKQKGDAYVITNCHVVYDDTAVNYISNEVKLFLYGQDMEDINYKLTREYCKYNGHYVTDSEGEKITDYSIVNYENYAINATVVAASVNYDIALLKISGSEILKNSDARVAEFAESDEVYMGQSVYAVGYPEGEGMSATAGVISKTGENVMLTLSDKDNPVYSYYRVIRTDAAVNGGNSGGALYNSQGKIVGIVNSRTVKEDVENMAYALPASNVKRLWLLMKNNEVKSGISNYQLGVSRATFPAEYDISATSSYLSASGARVIHTVSVTRAGGNFAVGDVIKHIKVTDASGETVKHGECEVTDIGYIDDVLLTARVGYTISVTVLREGQELTVNYVCTRNNLTVTG